MLEQPTVVFLGNARDVVRGIAYLGGDLDGSFVLPSTDIYPDDLPALGEEHPVTAPF